MKQLDVFNNSLYRVYYCFYLILLIGIEFGKFSYIFLLVLTYFLGIFSFQGSHILFSPPFALISTSLLVLEEIS